MSETKACPCGYEVTRARATYCSDECATMTRTYGMGKRQYDLLFEAQGGRCAICRCVQRRQRLSIDHDHHTGRIRGLLCTIDNHHVLSAVKHSAEYAQRTADYLREPPADRVLDDVPVAPQSKSSGRGRRSMLRLDRSTGL